MTGSGLKLLWYQRDQRTFLLFNQSIASWLGNHVHSNDRRCCPIRLVCVALASCDNSLSMTGLENTPDANGMACRRDYKSQLQPVPGGDLLDRIRFASKHITPGFVAFRGIRKPGCDGRGVPRLLDAARVRGMPESASGPVHPISEDGMVCRCCYRPQLQPVPGGGLLDRNRF